MLILLISPNYHGAYFRDNPLLYEIIISPCITFNSHNYKRYTASHRIMPKVNIFPTLFGICLEFSTPTQLPPFCYSTTQFARNTASTMYNTYHSGIVCEYFRKGTPAAECHPRRRQILISIWNGTGGKFDGNLFLKRKLNTKIVSNLKSNCFTKQHDTFLSSCIFNLKFHYKFATRR